MTFLFLLFCEYVSLFVLVIECVADVCGIIRIWGGGGGGGRKGSKRMAARRPSGDMLRCVVKGWEWTGESVV